jgi:hypothetical protein
LLNAYLANLWMYEIFYHLSDATFQASPCGCGECLG